MATQRQDDANNFPVAPEKVRRPNSHPFPPNPGKNQSSPATSGGSSFPGGASDSYNRQNGDIMAGEVKRKRSRKSDVQMDGVKQPESLHYGYESYLAYDTIPPGFKDVRECGSFPSRASGDFFNLSANSHVDPVWESDSKYNNLFSNQNGHRDSERVNFTQAQFGWSNSNEFSQVPLHPGIDLTSGSTFLPFQYKRWDSKDPGVKIRDNFGLSQKEMIEEIEYMFAQNEWDLPNVSQASPGDSNLGVSLENKGHKCKDDAFKEGSFFGDLWSKMEGKKRTLRLDDQPPGLSAEKESNGGQTHSQEPKVLYTEDLGDCSSLSSEEKVLLESLISKMNSKKQVNGLRRNYKESEETQRVTKRPTKEANKCAIQKQSSITVDYSTVKPDLSKLGHSRIQESGSEIGSSGRAWNQGVQKKSSSNSSEQDFPMLGSNIVDSARKRSKKSQHEDNFQSMPESLSKRDHSGKTKEETVFLPTPSKNAKKQVEKTLKKQKVLQSDTEMTSQVQKKSFEPQNGQESDIEMDNVEEEEEEEIGHEKNIDGLNEKKNVGAAKRLHNDTEKLERTIEQPHSQENSPPQIKKKKKRKKKQGQSSLNNGEGERKSNQGPVPEIHKGSEPVTLPDQKEEVTSESKRQDRKKEGCCVGGQDREQIIDSKQPMESKTLESQQEINHQAEQKKTASAWAQVSGKNRSLADRTGVSKDMSDRSCTEASQPGKHQGNVNESAKVDSDRREKGTRNGLRSFEHQESSQNVHKGLSGSDGTSCRRKEKENECYEKPKNLKVGKDTTVPLPRSFSSKSQEHLPSVPSERSQKGTSNDSVPTNKIQESQAAGKTATKANVVPDKAGHVLKDDFKSTRDASKSLPQVNATFSSSPTSSSTDGKCQKEIKPSRSEVNEKMAGCDGDETVRGETKEKKQERESDGKCGTKTASDTPHSKMDQSQQSPDEEFFKQSGRTRRNSEGNDKSKERQTFDELRSKRQDKSENKKQQRERSNSGKDRKPGRDSTAKSKHSGTSRSGHIFVNKHGNFARWKKKMTFENLIAASFAVFSYSTYLIAEIWSELPQFGVLLLLCLWAQGLSTFHYFKDICMDAIVDIFHILVAILPVILRKCSKFKFLWTSILKPILLIATCLLLLAFYITFRLIRVMFRLLRGIYRLRCPPGDKGEYTHHETDSNTGDAYRDRQEFHGDSFSQNNYRQSEGHTSNGSSENNSTNGSNFGRGSEDSRAGSFNNFNSYRRNEGMNGTSGGGPFGSRSDTTTSSNKSQSSQSTDSRPVNKGAGTAIRRILLAEEEDPYNILGLDRDCLQEDIKKAYRRLAVVVHPDKCDHPDAQRAFQKLQVAHDKIGSEENRRNFELQKRQSEMARNFMDEFQKQYDLLNNSMRCQCGNLHPKIETDRNPAAARYCWQHSTFHAAFQNDIWAETSCMGLKIHCLYCDGGIIYDVTQWAQCQKILGRMEKNGCRVTVRMEGSPEPQNKPPPNFEDFFRHFDSGTHRGRGGSGPDRSRQKNKKKKKNGRR